MDGQAMLNAAGRVARAYTGSHATDLGVSYGLLGNPTSAVQRVNGGAWITVGESYYPNGVVASLSVPGVPTISYGLDGAEAKKTYAAVGRAEAAWPTLQAAGAAHGISPALLAAVGVRESAFEDVNQKGGFGVGVFQLTVTAASGVSAAGANNLAWAVNEAARQLAAHRSYAERRFPWFAPQEIIEATAALYNTGPGNSRHPNITGSPATIDVGAAGGDYGSDVWELMSCFE